MNVVIQDFKDYLDGIEKLSGNLDTDQRVELENILRVMLTLLVHLKRDSRLGIVYSSLFDKFGI